MMVKAEKAKQGLVKKVSNFCARTGLEEKNRPVR